MLVLKILGFLTVMLFANEQLLGKCPYLEDATVEALPVVVLTTPIINITSATCTTAGTATIANYSVTNTYMFAPAGPTVSSGGAIQGMIAGISYTVTSSNGGFVSAPSGTFSISAPLAVPSAPNINITVATCEAVGTGTITNYSASTIYVFNPTGPTVSPGGAILEMTVGTSYIVTANIGGCTITASSGVFSISAPLAIISRPVINTTDATCTAAGTASIINYSTTASYTFTPSGPTVLPGGAINGMIAGTNYIVTASDGDCTTTASSAFNILAALTTPAVPIINTTNATCDSAGTATIINYNAANSYTFNPAGPTVSAGGIITGMNAGTNYMIAGMGVCTTALSGPFSILAPLSEATVPVIKIKASTCASAGIASIGNYDTSAVYTFTPAGPTILPDGTIVGMAAGTSYTVTATIGACTSVPSMVILILAPLAMAPVPAINTTVAACAEGGTASIANYTDNAVYTFTPAGPTVSPGGTILELTTGTNYTVTADIDGCATTIASEVFSIQAALPSVSVPVINTTDATCTAAGTASIANYNAVNTYTFTPAGPLISPDGTILGMNEGTNYIVTAGNGDCTALSQIFSISASFAAVPVPTIITTLPTCTLAGTASITNYSGTVTYIFNPAGPIASPGGAIVGIIEATNYTVTASVGGCATIAQSETFSVQPPLATSPTPIINTTTGGCTTAGEASIANYTDNAVYTFTPAGPTVSPDGAILGMIEGTNYTVTANIRGCTTEPSGLFSISASLTTISAPVISTTAATCTADGTATITNYSIAAAYTFSPEGPTVSSGGVILGMIAGTGYIVTAGNGSCTTVSSAVISLQAQLIAPGAPTINTTAATCVADGTASIANFNTASTYTFNPTGPAIGSDGLINGAVPGNYYTVSASNGSCASAFSLSFTEEMMKQSPVLVVTRSNNIDCVVNIARLNVSGGYSYTWSPAASLNNSHISNPVANPASTTVYHVVAINAEGCSKEDSIEVKVSTDKVENGYQVASAFTPNNDGKNDCFGVSYWGAVTNFRFTIYNRWGEIVFQTSDVSQCWDGKYKGREQASAGFPYIIYADTRCGSIFRKGLVVLIR